MFVARTTATFLGLNTQEKNPRSASTLSHFAMPANIGRYGRVTTSKKGPSKIALPGDGPEHDLHERSGH
jgi:hypothetical protein